MSNPWEKIKTPLSSYNVRRADYTHSFDFFWGKDISDDYLFLFECDASIRFPGKVTLLHGINISLPVSDGDRKTRLILRLNNKDDWDIFYSLCLDLIQATSGCSNEESVVAVIVRRLVRWHIFLKKYRTKIMSEFEQKGLIGELLFLKEYLLTKFSVSEALSFWQGPLDATQDFCIGDTAVEVKCQLGTSKPLIRISSVEQLNTQLSRLYLFVVTVGKGAKNTDNIINLPIIIGEIREYIQNSQPSSGDLFEDLLFQAGYLDLQEYSEFYFVVSRFRFYEVTDDFPRFHSDDIPEGIV
ncbi:MAG: PD-(D/E)XK motif protein, partial [Deltaproteobacteria bacterium]|nr:PD-(D/E)XK motif protein [Deltaproteobacteria bacterium]